MTAETHSQLANFIWSICNLIRGPYKRNEYRKVILPLTVLRRFDCLLEPTKAAVLAEYPSIKSKPETVLRSLLQKITKRPFYNLSKLDFKKLLDDPNQLAPNLNSYINEFSPNVRTIIERFGFEEHIARMAEKNLLYEVIKAFAKIDLSSAHIDNVAAALAACMHRLLHEPGLRAQLQAAGRENVRRFNWDTTARQTLAMFEDLVRA
jgi:type I restriction enzyme M protein